MLGEIVPHKCLSASHNLAPPRPAALFIVPHKCLSASHNCTWFRAFPSAIVPHKCLSASHNCHGFICKSGLLYHTNACPQATTEGIIGCGGVGLYHTNACPQATTIQRVSDYLELLYHTNACPQATTSWVDGIIARGQPKGFAITAGWMDGEVLNNLNEMGIKPETPVIVTNDINIIHIIRDVKKKRNAALSVGEIKRIPDVVRNPEAVLFDSEKQNILYVFSSATDDRKNKIVVEINWDLKKKGVVNFVNTAGKVSLYNLKESKYIVIKGVLE